MSKYIQSTSSTFEEGMTISHLHSARETITRETDQEEYLPHPYEPLPALGPLLGAVLVHEHRHPGHDHQDEQVLEQRVTLTPHQHSQHHHRDGFA